MCQVLVVVVATLQASVILFVVGGIMVLHILIPGTYDYARLQDKETFANVMNFMNLK